MFERLPKKIFYLLIFCLSFQVGLHFWPNFSFVSGVRIDYLSPTLYLLDILIILFILVSFLNFKKIPSINFKSNVLKIVFAVFILDLFLNLFTSKSWGAHLFGIIKLLEMGLFGLFVAKTFEKKDIRIFTQSLAVSSFISSVLAIWQFVIQSSVGGLWYFLGERTFNISTIGISTVNLNQELLRPYAAFPHPNVLAFFLLTSIVFSVAQLRTEEKSFIKALLLFSVLLSSVALVLTFSRITILLMISFFLYELFTKLKSKAYVLPMAAGIFIVVIFIFLIFLNSQFLFRGIDLRQDLIAQSFTIFTNNPYFGIGLNNFFINQNTLIKTISPINFQPVHNIFVLALLSLGLFGWWIFPIGLFLAAKSLIEKIRKWGNKNLESRNFYLSILFLLISVVIAGMFDHYFLTLEQGQIMFALILGLSFVS